MFRGLIAFLQQLGGKLVFHHAVWSWLIAIPVHLILPFIHLPQPWDQTSPLNANEIWLQNEPLYSVSAGLDKRLSPHIMACLTTQRKKEQLTSGYSVGMEMLQVTLLLNVTRMKTPARIILGEECGNDSTSKSPVLVHPRNNYEALQCAGLCAGHWGPPRGVVSRRRFTCSPHSPVRHTSASLAPLECGSGWNARGRDVMDLLAFRVLGFSAQTLRCPRMLTYRSEDPSALGDLWEREIIGPRDSHIWDSGRKHASSLTSSPSGVPLPSSYTAFSLTCFLIHTLYSYVAPPPWGWRWSKAKSDYVSSAFTKLL